MAISDKLMGLVTKSKRGAICRVSEDLRGKTICIYGSNDLGKTKQSSKLPNAVILPCEPGVNAINGAVKFPNNSWSDFTKNVKMFQSKEWTSLLEEEEITIIVDGVDSLGNFCQNFVCGMYGIIDISVKSEDSRVNYYKIYERTYLREISKLVLLGYTVVFLNHEAMDKDMGKISLAGDKRCTKPIKDFCDITVHLVSNGVDEDNNPIPSSAYLRETDEAFARCRYEKVVPYLEVFSAENLLNAVKEGIHKQNVEEGVTEDATNYKEQVNFYQEQETLEEVKEEIKVIFLRLKELDGDDEEMPNLSKYDEIVTDILGDVQISQTQQKHFEALKVVRDNLVEYLETVVQK